jgi:hypothetical protein
MRLAGRTTFDTTRYCFVTSGLKGYWLTDLNGILRRGMKSCDDYIAPFPPVLQCVAKLNFAFFTVQFSFVKLRVISELV